MAILFRSVEESDLPFIQAIYNYYISETTVSFRKKPVTPEQIREIHPVDHPVYKTLVAELNGNVVGYTSFSPYKKDKTAYNRTAEVSVYMAPENRKKGFGQKALQLIEDQARTRGINVFLAYITAENKASVEFFRKNGFSAAGLLKNVGEKFNRILDVVIYQKEL